MSRPTPGRVCPGPHLAGGLSRPTPSRGVQAQAQGVSKPRPGGCIPACTEADPPIRQVLLQAVRILLECILVNTIFLIIIKYEELKNKLKKPENAVKTACKYLRTDITQSDVIQYVVIYHL